MMEGFIADGGGSGRRARVSPFGQLFTGNVGFSVPVARTMGTDGAAVNFVAPKSRQFYVITDISLYANRNVGVNDATVILFEASSPNSTVQDKVTFQQEMLKQSSVVLTGLNWKIGTGKWLNGITDDDDVFGTVAGYFVPGVST